MEWARLSLIVYGAEYFSVFAFDIKEEGTICVIFLT